MRTVAMTRVTHRIGRMAAVGALALVLVGTAASPAAARPSRGASEAIATCQEAGGEPYYFDFMGVWAVGCEFSWLTTYTSDDGFP